MSTRALVSTLWVAALALLLGACASSDREPRPGPRTAPPPKSSPNLLVVMTDDQTLASFDERVMPKTASFFADGGTVFEKAIAAPPLCCPARAGFLTGRYAHNHGVVENEIGYATMKGKGETLPVALQSAGYRTAMIGKFLNGYGRVAGAEPAPGFDRWFAMKGYADYFDFEVSDDGEVRFVERYSTRALTEQAREFVARGGRRPFFLWLSYNAPHTVLPRDRGPCEGLSARPPGAAAYERFAAAELPRPRSFDQVDTSDRPSIADHPDRLGPRDVAEATQAWRCSLAAIHAVDRRFAALLGDLRRSGELERTVVVFLSDNGYFYGEHRLTDDKRLPLEPALRIPLAIRVGDEVPGDDRPGPAPARVDELVSQVDLAPTLLDHAGAPHCPPGRRCAPLDGRSLRPLLAGDSWEGGRAIPLSLADGWTYEAIRTDEELYMEVSEARKRDFATPRAELYDLPSDPDQLHNLAVDAGPERRRRIARLARRLERAITCAGVEGRDRRTAGRPFCE